MSQLIITGGPKHFGIEYFALSKNRREAVARAKREGRQCWLITGPGCNEATFSHNFHEFKKERLV